jgi:polyhydroxybutyrate depolymerase
MDAVADREGFLAVYPNGTGRLADRLLTWNAGTCCGYARDQHVDDVGFVRALLQRLDGLLPIDRARVYATGLSNGAMMAYRLAVEAPDSIAAVAPVAGGMVVEGDLPSRAVPLMHIHSVDDPRAPYGGGLGPPFPLTTVRVEHQDINRVIRRWAGHDGCPAEPAVAARLRGRKGSPEAGHTATKYVYAPCREGAEVVLWKLTGAGHVWPGGQRDYLPRLLGPGTRIIDANVEMWRFFSRFSLAGQAAAR